jgi:hypothetical protein
MDEYQQVIDNVLKGYDEYEAERLKRFEAGLQAIRERRLRGEITFKQAAELAIELRKEIAK